MPEWHRRQKVFDDVEDLNRDKLQIETRRLTEPESSERLDEEAAQQEAAETAAEGPPKVTLHPPELTPGERRAQLRHVEAIAIGKLFTALASTHMVNPELSLRVGDQRAVIDAVAESMSDSRPDFIVEIGYSRLAIPQVGNP